MNTYQMHYELFGDLEKIQRSLGELFGKPINLTSSPEKISREYSSPGGARIIFERNGSSSGMTISGLHGIIKICEMKLEDKGIPLEAVWGKQNGN